MIVKKSIVVLLVLFAIMACSKKTGVLPTSGTGTDTTHQPPVYSLDLTGYTLLRDYSFGKTRHVKNLDSLSAYFNPYGVAGTTVINHEWERYQPFNDTNHHITDTTLELTATANLGGIYNGGISSGQICTKATFQPMDSNTAYLFQLRVKIPKGDGVWPAYWLYSPGGTGTTASEIDIFEFWVSPTQNTSDWVGGDYGTGVGSNYVNNMTNQYVWHPGYDFADAYHVYTLVWKKGNIQKWVDNTLVKGTYFTWNGPSPQVIINLAMGGGDRINPNAAGTPFPVKYQVDYFRVYTKF